MAPLLPLDLLPIILSYLTIPDILRIRLVCRDFFYITKTHALWHTYIRRHILQNNIPLPRLYDRPLETLDAEELESLTFKAEGYRRNWISSEPTATHCTELVAVPDSRIIALHFLSRGADQWLLSLAMTRNNGLRAFTIQCWDLKQNPPVCIARRIFHHFSGIAFNRLSTGRAVVAVKSPEICLIDINPAVGDTPPLACVNVATIEDRAPCGMFLIGDYVLTQDDLGRIFLYHFERPQIRLEFVDPEGGIQPERILDVLVVDDWIILARTTTLELYALPTAIVCNLQMEPLAKHKWQWKVDTISLARPTSNFDGPAKPVQIALRYGSIHPWPVNFIHRYVLYPDNSFDPRQSATRENLPYSFPPATIPVIGSPIRLMATYDMTIGSHGTIVYIDSHTESYFGHSDYGQRLAGNRTSEEPESKKDLSAASRATSVYTVSEKDDWTRVVLNEEEGKLAIGYVDGRISIFDYA